jgi:hypothetical protein
MMKELDVLRLLLARRENYGITEVTHISGRAYSVTKDGKTYNAVVLSSSFDFYELRYHLAKRVPSLIVCFEHDTVVPITCISLRSGRIALPHDLPKGYSNVEEERHRSKTGSQVLLGMYLCGMRDAMKIVNNLKPRSRRRYLERARDLGRRARGRPVNS